MPFCDEEVYKLMLGKVNQEKEVGHKGIEKVIDVVGYIGLAVTLLAAILFLLAFAGFLRSPAFEETVGIFVVGQAFYNWYMMAALKYHSHPG